MRSAALCLVVALFGTVIAEPPSGYSYNRPSGGFGGGFSGGFSSGGSYQQVSHGGQTSEGQSLDHGLLEQIKQVLLRDESSSGSHGGGFSGGLSSSYGAPSSSYGAPSASFSAPSSSYGAPSSSYGAPSFGGGRVTGLDLEGIQQAIQVAQFSQVSHSSGGGGYPSRPSSSYGSPY